MSLSSSLPLTSQVRVGVRVRPLTSKERGAGGKPVVACDAFSNAVELATCRFTYDAVLDTNITQTELYKTVSAPLLNSFLEGYNATVSVVFGHNSIKVKVPSMHSKCLRISHFEFCSFE